MIWVSEIKHMQSLIQIYLSKSKQSTENKEGLDTSLNATVKILRVVNAQIKIMGRP